MFLGLKLWSINTDAYLCEARRLHAEGGFDFIELYIVPGTVDTLPQWKALGIPFTLHAPHFAHGMNLAKREKDVENRKKYEEVKHFADYLNASRIVFHGGVEGAIEETARQLDAFQEPRALIENKPYRALPNMGGKFCRGHSPEEIRYVVEQCRCGFCLDFGHAVCAAASMGQEAYGIIDEFQKFKPTYFHLSDVENLASEYDTHPHLGTGVLDIPKILTALPSNSRVTIETVKNSPETLDDFIEDIKWIRHL